jgi:hypothetical protein
MHDAIMEMMKTNPQPAFEDARVLTECIQACLACAQACVACADACLGERKPDMLDRCIRLNLDCADICGVTGRIATRQQATDVELVMRQIEVCARACATCAEECEKHQAMHAHCRICADACRRCEKACRAAHAHGMRQRT